MAPSLMARWMLEVEEQLNRLLAPAHFHRLATDHGRERGQSLLTVELFTVGERSEPAPFEGIVRL
jgi:D-lyxose ketol-isomerase